MALSQPQRENAPYFVGQIVVRQSSLQRTSLGGNSGNVSFESSCECGVNLV